MNPTQKLSYRLFLEKIFFGIKDILIYDYKLICVSYDCISVWTLYNKNLVFHSCYNKKSKEYMRIKKIIKEINDENS